MHDATAAAAPSQTCHFLLLVASSAVVTASSFAGLTIGRSTALFSHGLVLLAAAAIVGAGVSATTRCA